MQHNSPNSENNNNTKQSHARVGLYDVPNEIKNQIFDYLSHEDQFYFALSHSIFYKYVKEKRKEVLELGEKLLFHAINGEIEETISIVSRFPYLLLYKGRIQDSLGRTFSGTVFQLALGARDIKMCKKLKSEFSEMINGYQEAEKQLNEQFPPDLDLFARYNYKPLMDAILNEKFIDGKLSEITQEAITQFKEYFVPNRAIHRGYHFNLFELFNAYGAYTEMKSQLNSMQDELFWKEIMSYLESCISVCDRKYIKKYIDPHYPLINRDKLAEILTYDHTKDKDLSSLKSSIHKAAQEFKTFGY